MFKSSEIMHLHCNGDNTTYLPKTVDLRNFAVATMGISGYVKDWEWKESPLYLCSDICEESCVSNTLLRCLCSLSNENENGSLKDVGQTLWLKVVKERLSCVRLYITDERGFLPSFEHCSVRCTLAFVPYR